MDSGDTGVAYDTQVLVGAAGDAVDEVGLDGGQTLVIDRAFAMTWSVTLLDCDTMGLAESGIMVVGHGLEGEEEARTVRAPVVQDLSSATTAWMDHAHPWPAQYCGAWVLLSWTNEATPAVDVAAGGELLEEEGLALWLQGSVDGVPVEAWTDSAAGATLGFVGEAGQDVALEVEEGQSEAVLVVRTDRAAALASVDWSLSEEALGQAVQAALLAHSEIVVSR
ncbi:MAG: hypothetical protein H6742_11980 [Alphaproteobacteria bacterium]|nr:hypothetical protein [Alphaproteobacteria bacterium]